MSLATLTLLFDPQVRFVPSARGERGTIMVVASDRRQARTILRYIRGLLNEVPLLKRMIERETAEGFDLTNRVTIEISTASMKSVRGYTVVAALLDEAASFRLRRARHHRTRRL